MQFAFAVLVAPCSLAAAADLAQRSCGRGHLRHEATIAYGYAVAQLRWTTVIFIMQGLCYVVDITVVLTTFIITFDFIFNLIDVEGFTLVNVNPPVL